MSATSEPVVFVVPGDLHLTEAGFDNHQVALKMVDEVNGWIRPDFVQFIGDNVQDATEEQFRLFDDLRGRLAVPHHALVGDHDVKDDPEARGFRAHVGDTFGSTRLRGFRFVRLDTQQAKPLGIAPEQIAWLGAEVDAARSVGERVVIFQHNYPYQIWEDFAGPGIDDWRAIVQTRPVQMIFCGHTHYGQVANDGRNVVVATRSIGDPEGGPPGYTIGYLHGEDLALTYRTPEEDGPVVLVTHPRETLLATGPPHIIQGPDEFRVRTWSPTPIAEVCGRLNDGGWFSFVEQGTGDWKAPLPGGQFAKGEHTAEVVARDQAGRSTGRRLDFSVDPTGRYTAVPFVHPRVTRTAFC